MRQSDVAPYLCLFLYWAMGVDAMAQIFRPPSAYIQACPIDATKQDFDPQRFFGDWYAQEYNYVKPMPKLRALSCVGFHYSTNGFGDLQTNFTFQFPPQTGQVFHIPTFSIVDTANPAMWETKLADRHLVKLVLETDYDNWAVLVECQRLVDGTSKYLSTRILSRSRNVPAEEIGLINSLISEGGNNMGRFRYTMDHDGCNEIA